MLSVLLLGPPATANLHVRPVESCLFCGRRSLGPVMGPSPFFFAPLLGAFRLMHPLALCLGEMEGSDTGLVLRDGPLRDLPALGLPAARGAGLKRW